MDPKKTNCEVCHTVGKDYALFTDNKFHNLGVGADINENMVDLGRSGVTKNENDWGAFKTPSLRNIAQRAPYMHDGTFPTLNDALGHYIGGGNPNPHLGRVHTNSTIFRYDAWHGDYCRAVRTNSRLFAGATRQREA
ncbi:MAG TPA: hypothetical protein VGS78_15130 [Candidatus Sulfotelmatobacter sp.]|nr:hypothetical protein [Candidatus Sulfotelmatobacter sp.]